MIQRRHAVAFASILALFAGCGADPSAPTVELVSTAPHQLVYGEVPQNDLTIVVRVHDDDGDLDGGTAEIHDCRAPGHVTQVAIAADPGATDSMPSLEVRDIEPLPIDELTGDGCADQGVTVDPEQVAVRFCVVPVDAAGHRGHAVCTSSIPLVPGPIS
jgi:hypothetical protein